MPCGIRGLVRVLVGGSGIGIANVRGMEGAVRGSGPSAGHRPCMVLLDALAQLLAYRATV